MAKSATLAWLAVIVFLTLLYAFELVQRAVVLIADGSPIALAMGLAIIVLPPFAVAFSLLRRRNVVVGHAHRVTPERRRTRPFMP